MPRSKKSKRERATLDLDGCTLDGRTLEGGGQLLRLAVGLSALTGRQLNMSHIRGSRHGGGLKAQHLACVKWLGEACDAEILGAKIKSSNLVFSPGKKWIACPPTYRQESQSEGSTIFHARIDIGSPGSIALVLQAVLPFILFSPPETSTNEDRPSVRLVVTGGTNVTNSPSYEYLTQVLFPTLALIGLPTIDATLEARGWSTGKASMGSTTFTIPTLKAGEKLPAFIVEPSNDDFETTTNPAHIVCTVLAPQSMWEHFREDVLTQLQATFSTAAEDIQVIFEDSQHEKRVYLILVATVVYNGKSCKLGSDELLQGQRGKERIALGMAKRVVATLAEDFRSKACVDRHMMDQLVIFQALSDGKSDVWRGASDAGQALGQNLHAETAEWITSRDLGAALNNGKGRGAGYAAKDRRR